MEVTEEDAFMRYNYAQSYNVNARDGSDSSTRYYDEDREEQVKPRMYNHPTKGPGR